MADREKSGNFKRGRPALYPWAQWFNGDVWRVRRGSDFVLEARKFRHQVHSAARRHGVRVRTRLDGDDIVLQVTG